MSKFCVFPIPDEVARQIREDRIDAFGHRLTVSVASENDTGPCRSCLPVVVTGDGRLLFSDAPNPHDHPYNEIGPIYIHAAECQPYINNEVFPPELRTRRPLTLRCYDDDGMMVDGELVGDRPVEEVIDMLFERPEVKYLHARTASVGCFIARIERTAYEGS